LKTSCYYIRHFFNLFVGARPPIQIKKYYKNSKINIKLSSMLFDTSPIIYHDLNVSYVKDAIRRFNQRYAGKLEILTYS